MFTKVRNYGPHWWVNGCGHCSQTGLMLIGEAPGKVETWKNRVMVGPTGQEVNKLLERFGWGRIQVYTTNFIKYALKDEKKHLTADEISFARELIINEVRKYKPKVIIAMGKIAVEGVFNKKVNMETVNGVPEIVDLGREVIVVPSYHPAAAFRDVSNWIMVERAFEIAARILKDPEAVLGTLKKLPRKLNTVQVDLDDIKGGVIALDTETYSDGSIYTVQLSDTPGTAAIAYLDKYKDVEKVKNILKRNPLVIMHVCLFDLRTLMQRGIRIKRFTDTAVIAFLLQEYPLKLKQLGYTLLNLELPSYDEVTKGYKDLSEVEDKEKALTYMLGDPDLTLRCYNQLLKKRYKGMDEVLQRDMDICKMLIAMMEKGITFDREKAETLENEIGDLLSVLKSKVVKVAGWNVNLNAPAQVAELLYEDLGLGKRKAVKKTATGQKRVNTDTLKLLEDEHEVVKDILDWKEGDTVRGRYAKKLRGMVDADERIHTKITLLGAKHSGRLASSSPNLMSIPVRSELGRRVRECFIASPGYILLSYDYSQIEMRVMAHLSEDVRLIDAYIRGADIHTETAIAMFRLRAADLVDEMAHRHPAKRTSFGIINNISPGGLCRELNAKSSVLWTLQDCEEMLANWFDIYPGVKRRMEYLAKTTRDNGEVFDMWGRREKLPAVRMRDNRSVEAAVRMGINQAIQSGAQGIIKEAMRNIWKEMEWAYQAGLLYPLLQIHDDLLFEVREDFLSEAQRTVKEIMEGSVKLRVPVIAEGKMGKVWGSMSKIK